MTSPSQIQRYDYASAGMYKADAGKFVRYSDIESLVQGLKEMGEQDVELPRGVKRVDERRLAEILSGYMDFPVADHFEVRALAYEVRNWRMHAASVEGHGASSVGAVRKEGR